jgi:hypothetical protein
MLMDWISNKKQVCILKSSRQQQNLLFGMANFKDCISLKVLYGLIGAVKHM